MALHDFRDVGDGHAFQSADCSDDRALQRIFQRDQVVDLVPREIAEIETLVGLGRARQWLMVGCEDDPRHLARSRTAIPDGRYEALVMARNLTAVDRVPKQAVDRCTRVGSGAI